MKDSFLRQIRSPDFQLTAGLFVFALLLLGMVAARLGVADGETAHLELAAGYGRLLDGAVHEGVASVTRDDVERALRGPRPAPMLPYAPAGYLWLLLARRVAGGLTSELFALRAGGVVFAACAPPLVYLLARESLPRRWAFLAAVLSLLGPRLLVDAVSLGGGGTLVASTLAAVFAHRVADRTGSVTATVLGAVSLGVAVSLSLAALALFLPLLLIERRSPVEGRGPGLWALPRATVALAAGGLPIAWALSPAFWPPSAETFLTLFERGLSPSLLAVHALGRAPLATTPPRAHVLEALLLAVPSTTLALALLAPAALLAKRARLPSPFLFAAAFVLAPVVLPRSVASFPAPWCLAVPFVAICSAHGARFVASVSWNPRRPLSHAPVETVVAALALLEPVVSSVDLPTAPAAVPWLVAVPGPASRVAPFDGSLLGAVGSSFRRAPGIGLTRVWAPEIATEVWEGSVRWRRLPRGVVRAEREADADYLLLAGRRSPPPGFEVVRTLRRGTRTVAVLYRRLLSRPAA